MADNITLNSGSGGATLATDDIGGTHYQINKLAFGPLDTATLVEASVGLPIQEVAAMDVSAATLDTTISGAALTSLAFLDTIVYNEDVGHGAADPGVAVYAIRDDALAAGAAVNADLDYTPFRVTNLGALWTTPSANSLGGCKAFTSVDLDQTEEDIASGPCTVYGIYAWNATDAPLWLQIFNTNTVTVGSTVPDHNFIVPANADLDGAGVVIPIPVQGLAFSTALTMAMTTGVGTDSGAPGANDGGVFVTYQD